MRPIVETARVTGHHPAGVIGTVCAIVALK
jgi:hypothetical protein